MSRAYLFDRILFIQGGRIVFDGTPDEVLEYFEVPTLDHVYIKLDSLNKSSEEWQNDFLNWRKSKPQTSLSASGSESLQEYQEKGASKKKKQERRGASYAGYFKDPAESPLENSFIRSPKFDFSLCSAAVDWAVDWAVGWVGSGGFCFANVYACSCNSLVWMQ